MFEHNLSTVVNRFAVRISLKELNVHFRTLLEELNRLKSLTTSRDESPAGQDRENDVMNEIKLLRQHKTRHESRVKVLEDHNMQLQQQLAKLKQLLEQVRIMSY